MRQPLISVVLPTKDRSVLLKRSIASVLGQIHNNLELIVINDGSSDDTTDVLSGIKDSRIRIINNAHSIGASAARNKGIKLAKGQYLAFQDDDDIWLPDKLERQLDVLINSKSDWCISCNIRILKGKAIYIGGERYISQLKFEEGVGIGYPDWSLIATPGWLVHKNLLEKSGGFDERIRSFDDWELGLRLIKHTQPILIDEPLWIQDWDLGSGLIYNKVARANDLKIIMESHGKLWEHRPDVIARHWYIIGRTLSLTGASPAGRKELRYSLTINWLQPRAWFALVVTYLGLARNAKITALIRQIKALKPRFGS